MSWETQSWAARQRPGSAAAKLVLLGLASCADANHCAYPSIDWLCEFSDLNRKTVISALQRLESGLLPLVRDTGERRGRTKQVKVYRLSADEGVSADKDTKNGTVPKTEQSQKRNSTVFSRKESQKRDTEPVREPSSSETKVSSENSQSEPEKVLPEHVVEAWNDTAERCGLPRVRSLNDTRARHLRTMIRRRSIDEIAEALRAIERCRWMHGENDRGWRVDFDFILSPTKFDKLIEGSYDRQGKPS